jgi:hypothetical protein
MAFHAMSSKWWLARSHGSLTETSLETKMLNRIKNWANQNEGFIALVGIVITLGGLLLPELTRVLLSSVAPALVGFVQQYKETAVWIGVFILVLAFYLVTINHRERLLKIEEKIQVLENLPETLLGETASANLSNWSFGNDQWTSDQDGLSVTRSFFGGICKIGATWENYEFVFEFKIIHQCAAWIVRAKSDSIYVMVQCNTKQLRPHVLGIVQGPDGRFGRAFQVIKEVDHNLSLKEWNRARTEVVGHSIKVWINDTLVWSDSELLKNFPMGTVGFRCADDEHALFRSINVLKK